MLGKLLRHDSCAALSILVNKPNWPFPADQSSPITTESPDLLFQPRAVEAAALRGNLGNALPAAKARLPSRALVMALRLLQMGGDYWIIGTAGRDSYAIKAAPIAPALSPKSALRIAVSILNAACLVRACCMPFKNNGK